MKDGEWESPKLIGRNNEFRQIKLLLERFQQSPKFTSYMLHPAL